MVTLTPMHQVNLREAQSFFYSLISQDSSEESLAWLNQKLERLRKEFLEKEFYLSFSLLPRYFSKEKLKSIKGSSKNSTTEPSPSERVRPACRNVIAGRGEAIKKAIFRTALKSQEKTASQLRQGFDPSGFTVVQASRVLLVLMIPADEEIRFLKILNNLFSTGEVNELIALYSALPILSYPALLKARASEGIRTNMTVVFDAVALNNPYPSEFLEDDAFNQMVLKAVFIERPLDRIYGLDARANEKLARMLSDYAHERWAASRYVTPELWRPVGPFIDDSLLKDIERLLEQGSELERQAAALAIQSSKLPKATELIPRQLKVEAEKKEFDWHTISKKWRASKMIN